MHKNIKLHPSWLKHLEKEFEKPYMKEIKSFLEKEIKSGKTIYPEPKNIFAALNYTPLDKVKVVIIGQDPYHGENQAHGLAFSVPKNQKKLPPSLKNIFKELNKKDTNGNLESWTKQGVLLLNAILTVEAGKPTSHSKIGWENFTNEIIKLISNKKENVIFLLWGAYAQKKSELIDSNKHFILKTTHPSPFSAHKGFLGSGCFTETNKILKKLGKKEINW